MNKKNGISKVLIIATYGFEEAELFEPLEGMREAGISVTLASLEKKPIHGVIYDASTSMSNPSDREIIPNITIEEINIDEYSLLYIPGGVISPDKLRMVPEVVEVVKNFYLKGKTIASICHGPWLLIESDIIKGKKVAGWYSIHKDLTNAGAEVLDKEVVVDGNIITSRMPSDIPAFLQVIKDTLIR